MKIALLTLLQSDYSGEMWWCCGKAGKDAVGCKVAKHYTKEEEEEDHDKQDEDDDATKKLKKLYTRCLCCKEKGHDAESCPRDPNVKNIEDLSEEEQRLALSQIFRKVQIPSLSHL